MAYADSAWGYDATTLSDPVPGVSAWGYASTTLIDSGKPNLVLNNQETSINWHIMKNGSELPVLRWYTMTNGSAVPLKYHSATWTPTAYTAGADAVGSTSYSIPSSDTIYVSTTGSDANPGTLAQPLATLSMALTQISVPGTTIIVRGGAYHEGEIEAGTKPTCVIQNYPGETVWFDGATTLTGWSSGPGVWTAPYSLTYDRNLGKGSGISTWSGAATRTIVDQVWLDTTQLIPVADGTTPGVGQFSVDQTAHTLTIGSDPTGKTVRIVDLKFLMAISSPMTIRGVGIRRYTQAMIEYRSAALIIGANSTLEQVTIQDCSVDALSMSGSGINIRRCTIQDTRHSGVMGDNTGGLVFEQSIVRRCNRADFDAEPTTAGIKLTRVFNGVTIRNCHIEDIADGAGIWFDTTVSRSVVSGNTIIGTSALGTTGFRMKNGIEIEGSDGGVYSGTQYYTYIIGNRVSDCRQAGLILFDSGWIKVWNNSLSAAVALYLWQDYRENDGSNPSTEGTAIQSPWHTTNIEVINNALNPEAAFNTQLRCQTNTDAVFKIAGGTMLSSLHANWFQAAGSGLMGYISNAAGTAFATPSTPAALASLNPLYGGPLSGIMDRNSQGNTTPNPSTADPIPSNIATIYSVPVGFQMIGPILPSPIKAT